MSAHHTACVVMLKTHPITQLPVLLDLDARIAVAPQDHGVVALCTLLLGVRGALRALAASLHAIAAITGKVLPAAASGFRFQYDGHITLACDRQVASL